MYVEELYRFAFPDGTKVIVIDDEDGFHWGTLTTRESEMVLTRGKAVTALPWVNVKFIKLDDFDLRYVRGPFPTQPEVMLRIAAGIRNTLVEMSKELAPKVQETVKPRMAHPQVHHSSIRFGDPFEVEAVPTIYNVGNTGPQYWGSEAAETVVLHQLGRIGLLWDLHSVYELQ